MSAPAPRRGGGERRGRGATPAALMRFCPPCTSSGVPVVGVGRWCRGGACVVPRRGGHLWCKGVSWVGLRVQGLPLIVGRLRSTEGRWLRWLGLVRLGLATRSNDEMKADSPTCSTTQAAWYVWSTVSWWLAGPAGAVSR